MTPLISTIAYLYIGGVVSFLFKWSFGFTEEKDNFGPGSHIVVAVLWPLALLMILAEKIVSWNDSRT